MSFFARQTRQVDLGDGNTVVLQKLNGGEKEAAESAAMKLTMNTSRAGRKRGDEQEQEQEAEMVIDVSRLSMERLIRSVKSWDGPGFDGREPTAENIRALPEDVIQRLQSEMAHLAPSDEGKAEKK